MRIKKFNAATLALCLSHALLLGCGGDDMPEPDLNPPVTLASVAGAYGGTLSGSTSSDFQALLLPNGDFWSLYGYNNGSIFYIDGFVQGVGDWNDDTFTTNDLRDFGFVPAIQARMNATFDKAGRTISGKSVYDGQTVRFSGGPLRESLYRFNTPASISSVTGHWDTMSTEGGFVSINISADGRLALSDGGCTGSGAIRPLGSGDNVFVVTVTFGGFPCAMPNQTAQGIAVAYPLLTGQTQLIAAATNSSRTVGIAVFGIR